MDTNRTRPGDNVHQSRIAHGQRDLRPQGLRRWRRVEIVVDFGSNIGISALFFLTRRTTSRVYCFEPDPRNTDRLRRNLSGFEDRYVLSEAAVAAAGGRATFMREDTGRYGHLLNVGNRPNTEPLEVDVIAAVAALDEVIDREGRIDLLKIDTEGNEEAIVAAITQLHYAKDRSRVRAQRQDVPWCKPLESTPWASARRKGWILPLVVPIRVDD